MRNSKIQFVRSLGYLDPHGHLYSALMLQPKSSAPLRRLACCSSTVALPGAVGGAGMERARHDAESL